VFELCFDPKLERVENSNCNERTRECLDSSSSRRRNRDIFQSNLNLVQLSDWKEETAIHDQPSFRQEVLLGFFIYRQFSADKDHV